MFLVNRYSRTYFSIIESAKIRGIDDSYHEKHHIIPRSLGGDNSVDNIVKLTYREHFLCHRLLVKMTEGKMRQKMACALWAMTRKTGNRITTSKQYSVARLIYINHHPNSGLSEEVLKARGKKVSEALKGRVFAHHYSNISKYHDMLKAGTIDNPRTKNWIVTTPTGETIFVRNLAKFCKEHGLSKGSLCGSGKSKGYTARHAD